MVTPQIAPYGSWKSPITSNLVVSEAIEPSSIANIQFALDSQDTYWIEPRPNEGGRNVIVRRTPAMVHSTFRTFLTNVCIANFLVRCHGR